MKLKCNFDFKFKNPPRVLSCIFGFEVCFFKLEFKPGVGGGFLRAFTSQKGPGKGLPALEYTVTVGGDGEPSGSSGPSSGHQSVISEQPTLQSDPS